MTQEYESGIEGKFFHTFNVDGDIRYQGRVIKTNGDMCIMEYFSYIDGQPNGRKVINMSDIIDGPYMFYDTAQEMRDMYDGFHGAE